MFVTFLSKIISMIIIAYNYLCFVSDIVAHSDHSHLEGIGKSNPTTYTNLENQVLKADDNSSYQKLVSFLMLKYTHANTG
jgi:hypothetical protein